MSTYSKSEVDNMRVMLVDTIMSQQDGRVESHEKVLTDSVLSEILEMLDEYACGNMINDALCSIDE